MNTNEKRKRRSSLYVCFSVVIAVYHDLCSIQIHRTMIAHSLYATKYLRLKTQYLPSNLRNRAIRERPNHQFPHLVHYQDTKRQWQRNQPKFYGHGGSAKNPLDTRHHGDENRNRKRHSHTSQQPRVTALSTERIGLQNTKLLTPHTEQIAELQNNQCNKVNTLCYGVEMRQLILSVAVETF